MLNNGSANLLSASLLLDRSTEMDSSIRDFMNLILAENSPHIYLSSKTDPVVESP